MQVPLMKKIWKYLENGLGLAGLAIIFAAGFAVAAFYIYVRFKQAFYFGTWMDWWVVALIVLLMLYVLFELWRQRRR